MHGGFKVFRLSERLTGGVNEAEAKGDGEGSKEREGEREGKGETWDEDWELIRRNDEHESLAYGVDWSRIPETGEEGTVIGSCSFYDAEARLWRG